MPRNGMLSSYFPAASTAVNVAPPALVAASGEIPDGVTRNALCNRGNACPGDWTQHGATLALAFAPSVPGAGALIPAPDPLPSTFQDNGPLGSPNIADAAWTNGAGAGG